MFPYIVADIGGTNVCLGLVTGRNETNADYKICKIWSQSTEEFDGLESCLDAYIATLTGQHPTNACIAIAGPITADRVQMTNQNWEFSISGLRKKFGLKRLEVINDFAALAYSTLNVSAHNLTVVHAGTPVADAPRAIIGLGTGLGIAALVPTAAGWQPVPGEGGHIAFAPYNGKTARILELIRYDLEYVCAESLLSGPGLARLHQALAVIEGRATEALSPEQITTRAIAGTDPACRETLDLVCHLLGRTAGDISLIYGARGGVFLGGGILPRVENILLESTFMDGFQSKGVMRDYLVNVPVYLMTGQHPALLGAASWFYDQKPGQKK
ncbi:MAG: glucokinase [Proteobacteria bacterium]|nr:glucokinase [Pseudomonadota bacterium]